MKFLITGAAGFIGSHLTDRLIAEGHEVVGIDNLSTGRKQNFPHDKAILFEADIADRHRVYEIANYLLPDVVVHCAASYSDPLKWHRDTDTNVTGTINAVLAAKFHNARLLYFQTALPPISSYAISKIAGEQYIWLSEVRSVIFRLANMYGPRNLSGPIPTFYKRLTNGQACTVTDTRRDMVFIDDLIEGVMRAIAKPSVYGKFDMCSGTHLPIAYLYDAVADALGNDAQAERVPSGTDDVTQMELDHSPAARELGWSASTQLLEGVRVAVDWYREHGVDSTYTHLSLKG